MALNTAINMAEKIDSGARSGNIKTLGANIAGAALNGVVQGVSGGVVEADLSYDPENGFGASVGVTAGGMAGVGLSYSEGGGFGAYAYADLGVASVDLAYDQNNGFSAEASLGIEGLGEVGLAYSDKRGFSAEASFGGTDISVSSSGVKIGMGDVDLNVNRSGKASLSMDNVGRLNLDCSGGGCS